MEKIYSVFKSRKFWSLLVGLALLFAKAYNPEFPLSEDQIVSAVALLGAYIFGVALDK